MLHKKKSRPGDEPFKLKKTSLLLTVGDARNGDYSQDFALVDNEPTVDVEILGVALGCHAVRHPEVAQLLQRAVKVANDPDTWRVEGKTPQVVVAIDKEAQDWLEKRQQPKQG